MKPIVLLLAAALLLPSAYAANDDETAQLRAEVERLKAALEASRTSCSAASTVASAAASGPSATATASAIGTRVEPPAGGAVPSGYKLVKVEPERPTDERWRNRSAWEDLRRGMGKEDVEMLLGVDHSVTDGQNRSFWGYGKIGVNYQGTVIFVNDRLAVWTAPNF